MKFVLLLLILIGILTVLSIIWMFALALLSLGHNFYEYPSTTNENERELYINDRWERHARTMGNRLVRRVIDGDTISIVPIAGDPLHPTNKRKSVECVIRLAGIDAPESVHPTKPWKNCPNGKIASDYLKKILPCNTEVWVEQCGDRFDAYGRMVALVWLKKPTTEVRKYPTRYLLNAKLVAEGYAKPLTAYKNVPYYQTFIALGRQARKNERGLYSRSHA